MVDSDKEKNMAKSQDAQGRTIITVTTMERCGPAVERKLRERARGEAYDAGFSRIRKLSKAPTEHGVVMEYVAYRPRNLDKAPQEDE